MHKRFTLLAVSIFTGLLVAPGASIAEAKVSDDIRSQILDGKAQTLAEVLPLLPEALRESFTLVHSSRSRLQTSARFPGVILFGSDAKTILAFNGHASQNGYSSLDILEFNKRSGFFEPKRFLFNPSEKELATAEISERLGSSSVYLESNPRACARCHGQSNHPIFEAGYPEWKGFFGSNRDHLYGASVSEEINGFKKFQSEAKTNERYKALRFPAASGSKFSPYLDELTEKKVSSGEIYRYRPNLVFGAYLVRLNAIGIQQVLRASRSYQQLAPVLAYSLERCDFRKLDREKVLAFAAEFEAYKSAELNSTAFLSNDLKLNRELGARIAAALGVSADHWSLSLARKNETAYGYWSGYGDTLDFVHSLIVEDLLGSETSRYYGTAQLVGDSSAGGKKLSVRLDSIAAGLVSRNSGLSCEKLAQLSGLGK